MHTLARVVRAALSDIADVAIPAAVKIVADTLDGTAKADDGLSDDEADTLAGEAADAALEAARASFDSLAERARNSLRTIFAEGSHAAFAQLEIAPTDDQARTVNVEALTFAEQRGAEMVGRRLEHGALVDNPNARWRIDDTTRNGIRSAVRQAIEDGDSADELAQALRASYAFSDDRADTIARTEVAKADVEGSLSAYRASGVVEGKICLLGSEHEEPDECDDAAAMGVVPLDSDFGGEGDPPFHPRCVCDVAPVVSDDAEDE